MASQKDKIKVFSAPLTLFQMPFLIILFLNSYLASSEKAELCYMNLYEHSYSGNNICGTIPWKDPGFGDSKLTMAHGYVPPCVSPATDWQPVRGVPCVLPYDTW